MAGQSVFRLTSQLNLFAVLFWPLGIVLACLQTCSPARHHSTGVQYSQHVLIWSCSLYGGGELVQFSTITHCPPPLFLSGMLFIYGQDTYTHWDEFYGDALRQAGCGSGWIHMFLPDLILGSYLVFDNCKWWKEWKIYFKKLSSVGQCCGAGPFFARLKGFEIPPHTE